MNDVRNKAVLGNNAHDGNASFANKEHHHCNAYQNTTGHKIASRFCLAKKSYDASAVVQKRCVSRLIDAMCYVDIQKGKNIFEIGAGTGNLSARLVECFAPNILYVNDLYDAQDAKNMHACMQKYTGDVTKIILPNALDVIASSSALQWIYPLDNVLKKIHNALKWQGFLCINLFIAPNFSQILASTKKSLRYYSADDLMALIERYFLCRYVKIYTDRLHFDTPKDVLLHLKHTGVTGGSGNFFGKNAYQQFCKVYENFCDDDGYFLDYHSACIIAQKLL